jgi:hypothetical protein
LQDRQREYQRFVDQQATDFFAGLDADWNADDWQEAPVEWGV